MSTSSLCASAAMTIHDLPKELLLFILKQTSEMDKRACLQVCREWYRLLLPVVYHTVRITTSASFAKLMFTLSKSGPIKRSIRHLKLGRSSPVPYRVNDLLLGRPVVVSGVKDSVFCPSRSRLQSLQKYCPDIEFIDYDPSLGKAIRPFLAQWTSLRRIPTLDHLDLPLLQSLASTLTTLVLTRPAIIELNKRCNKEGSSDDHHLFQPLADLPNLHDLTLSCLANFGISENEAPLRLDLPRLLEACARLQSLCLCLFNVMGVSQTPWQPQQQHSRDTYHPLTALTLEIVVFESSQDVTWLNHATPHLASLSLYRVKVAYDPQPPPSVWEAFVEHHRGTLRHLAVERIWGPDEWKTAMLTAVRPRSLTVLKTGSLGMTIMPAVGSRKTSSQFVDVVLNALSPQASTVEASLWPSLLSVNDEFIEPLGRACRFLTDLELTGSTTPVYKNVGTQDVALDVLLAQLRHLKRLRLWYINVVASPCVLASPLEELWVFESTLCEDLFDYLALHCPLLQSVTVHRCYAFVVRPSFTTFSIQMPDTELQSLSIRNLNFLCKVYDKKGSLRRLRVMSTCSIIGVKHRFGTRYYYKDRYTPGDGLHLAPGALPDVVKVAEDAASDLANPRDGTTPVEPGARMEERFFRKLESEWMEMEGLHIKDCRRGFGIVAVHAKRIDQCSFEGYVVNDAALR